MSAIVHTTFDRKGQPTNLLTLMEWRRFARAWLGKDNWQLAAREYAELNGGSMVMLADDSLAVFTKLQFGPRAGKISRRTYKPGTWSWA